MEFGSNFDSLVEISVKNSKVYNFKEFAFLQSYSVQGLFININSYP